MESTNPFNIIKQIFDRNNIKQYKVTEKPLSIVDKKTKTIMQKKDLFRFLVHELPQEFCIRKADLKVIYDLVEQNNYPIRFCAIQSTDDINVIKDDFFSIFDKPQYRIVLLDRKKNELNTIDDEEYLSLYEAVNHIPDEYILIDYDDAVCKVLEEKSKKLLGR